MRCGEAFDALTNDSWQGKEFREMVRISSNSCRSLVGATFGERAHRGFLGGREVRKAIRALAEFSSLSGQRTHSHTSLKYLEDALESFSRCKHSRLKEQQLRVAGDWRRTTHLKLPKRQMRPKEREHRSGRFRASLTVSTECFQERRNEKLTDVTT